MDKEIVLKKVKLILKEEMKPITYNTWIKNLEIKDINNKKIILVVSSRIQKEFIEVRLLNYLSNVFCFVLGKKYTIEILY